MTPFHGLLAYPVTPMDADGAPDLDALGRVLAPLVDAGVDAVGLLGSTGNYAYLDLPARKRVLAAAVEALDGRVPLVVGVGAMRTDWAEDLARDAARAGADGLLLAPVSYQPLTEAEVHAHFRAVSLAGDLPLCVYDNPGTTHFRFTSELLSRLAQLPGVAAVKVPVPRDDPAAELSRMRDGLGDVVLGVSGMAGCGRAMLAGADAWHSSLAGSLPDPALALVRAAQAGDAEAVEAQETALAPLFGLMARRGSLRVAHAIVGLRGLCAAPLPRPLMPLDAEEIDMLAGMLDELD